MNRFFLFFVLLQISWCEAMHAQPNYLFENTPAAQPADTWNFIKYGEVGANLYTGTVNLSIPVYTYKDKDFEIPVSLTYASNGYTGNQRAGILGPDWILNAGGCITTDIRGVADPDFLYSRPGDQIIKGFLSVHSESHTRNPHLLWRLISQSAGGSGTGMPKPNILYCPDTTPDEYSVFSDAEPDIYHFNFPGHSGTFHFGYNNAVYVYNTKEGYNGGYKVEYARNPINSQLTYFKITTADGYKYYFHPGDKTYLGDGSPVFTAFRLGKIETPGGRCATITYQALDSIMTCRPYGNMMQGNIFYQHSVLNAPASLDAGMVRSDGAFETGNSTLMVPSVIRIDNGPVIAFEYMRMPAGRRDKYRGSYAREQELNNTFRLKNITVAYGGDTLKRCDMTYKMETDSRTNFLEKVNIKGEGEYTMAYYFQGGGEPPLGTLSIDHWGYYNGRNNSNSSSVPFLMISQVDALNDETITGTSRNPDAFYAKNGMLRRITYPTGGYTEFDYEAHNYSRVVKRVASNGFIPALYSQSGICGGLRLKQIRNYRSGGDMADSREYEYANGTSSSGILLYMPRYKISYNASIFNTTYQESNMTYYSSGIQAYQYTPIEYGKVTEKRNDGSRIVYTYSNAATSPKYMDGMSTAGFSIAWEKVMANRMKFPWQGVTTAVMDAVTPLRSLQAERGKLLKKEIFASAAATEPLYIINNQYDTTRVLNTDWLPAYLVRRFGYTAVNVDNYKKTGETEVHYFSGNCLTRYKRVSHNHYGMLTSQSIDMSGKAQEDISYVYPYQGQSSDPVCRAMEQHHIFNLPSEIWVYRTEAAEPSDDPFQPVPPRIKTDGRKYTYCLPNNSNTAIIRPSKIECYNKETKEWYTEIEFIAYDLQGNLLESRDKNGIYSCYVWGYNGLYLVARIENLNLTALKNSVASLQNISANPLEGAISDNVRTELRSKQPGAQVTLYDYIPFTGLSKITGPDGMVTSYEYNATGKLKGKKETNGYPLERIYYSPDNK